jgi:hypothetical protein
LGHLFGDWGELEEKKYLYFSNISIDNRNLGVVVFSFRMVGRFAPSAYTPPALLPARPGKPLSASRNRAKTRRIRMGDKANFRAWGVKTLVFVFPLAGGVRTASDYGGVGTYYPEVKVDIQTPGVGAALALDRKGEEASIIAG